MLLQGRKRKDTYLYNTETQMVTDRHGNCIRLSEPIPEELAPKLSIYIDRLFHKMYIEQNEVAKLTKYFKTRG